ncbi:hypothetical protein GBF35_25740 [Nonomuraea phyllanthi]|uniref:WhiB family transcriptional regulator n=1 Tax=Nonomuraea phyllanthi TaxID=2219224 RepID=UPI001292CF91|nr:WhiB family transcriptional regulator [Nonomuraea phyllanthi]QFY09602.1 hypothetical protein GBF35_25740 [Nonomuraea phyllanthi]
MTTLLTAIGAVPAWHRDAACGYLGKLFASKKPRDVDAQRRVCAGCPALSNCRADALAKPKHKLPDLVMAGRTRAEHLDSRTTNARRACTKCDEKKPLTDFNLRTGGKHGRRSICKKCENARQRAAYQAKKTQTNTEGTTA